MEINFWTVAMKLSPRAEPEPTEYLSVQCFHLEGRIWIVKFALIYWQLSLNSFDIEKNIKYCSIDFKDEKF